MRLIDADALKDEVLSLAVLIRMPHLMVAKDAVFVIDNAPTIDAVEVVRCKDCVHKPSCKHTRSLGINGYCSEGERE